MAKKSKAGTLQAKDWIRGLVVSVATSVLMLAQEMFKADADWSQVDYSLLTRTSIAAGIAYILKNLCTNSDDKMLKKEPKKIGTDNPMPRN